MNEANHEKERHRALVAMVLCECAAFALALAAAWHANSLTLWANCLRVGLDLPASFFALYVSARILRREDSNFDYGFGKWENLASLVNVPVLFVGLGFLAVRAARNFAEPSPVGHTGFGMAVLVVFGGVNFWLASRFHKLHLADGSPLLHAQFILYRNAACASLFSILALSGASFAGRLGAYFDIGGAAILAVLTVRSALVLLRRSLGALLDETVEESVRARVAGSFENVLPDQLRLHRIRSRHAGSRVFLDIEIEFAPQMTVGEMLRRISGVRDAVGRAVPGAEVAVIPWDPTPAIPLSRCPAGGIRVLRRDLP